MSKPLYLTTTLPYVNADPHIGFALEMVQADILIRYRQILGDEVFFTTGTDEHGQKLFEAAQKAGKEPQAYVDEYAAKFRSLKEKLDLSPDLHFIRTTDPLHKAAAQEMWRRCAEKGDIEKRTYKGLYCVGDEAFMKETDLVDGRCPNHPQMDLVELEEENYFFKLSNYQDAILAYLAREGVIVPEWRRQEAIKFVEKGLEDFSISRVKEKMPWGIPVPGDESQVMYVWFDALTNYISTLGWPHDKEGNFKKFWEGGEVMQMAGKDQVRFQSIMWQGMLLSAGLKHTDRVFYHGFITSGGQKMSKSLGNVIDPIAIAEEYGIDALRYFLARHIHPFEDSDFTMERFKEAYNADLANGLGNLVARVMKMAEDNLNEPVDVPDVSLTDDRGVGLSGVPSSFDLQRHLESVWNGLGEISWYANVKKVEAYKNSAPAPVSSILGIDRSIQSEEPFKKVKSNSVSDKNEALDAIKWMVVQIWYKAIELEPYMPQTSAKIKAAILANKKPETLFPRKD